MAHEQIRSCLELTEGGYVEARVHGIARFHGRVQEVMPAMNMFWAVDSIGERRIIEFSEYEVRHVA